jgi:hypothetical protein
MEHLIIKLKETLIQRKMNEMNKVIDFNKDSDKDLILISSGRILELDSLIENLNEMIQYFDLTQKIKE